MCLNICEGHAKEIKKVRAQKETIKAYKVLAFHWVRTTFSGKVIPRGKMAWTSPYCSCYFEGNRMLSVRWKKGINKSSRKSLRLKKNERIHNEINEGFHCCLNRKDAESISARFNRPTAVVEVFINPEDVVGIGVWSDKSTMSPIRCIVATKLKIKKMPKIID